MAQPRSQLHQLLKGLEGVQDAYFQPDGTVKLQYPCIRYERKDSFSLHADNIPYILKKQYVVTVIDRDPDSLIPSLVEEIPLTKFDRFYISAGLNHYVFTLYF